MIVKLFDFDAWAAQDIDFERGVLQAHAGKVYEEKPRLGFDRSNLGPRNENWGVKQTKEEPHRDAETIDAGFDYSAI